MEVKKARPVRKARPRPESNGHGQLHLVVPKHIEDLARDGLLIPGRLSDTEAYAPLDFTSISSREVGRQHSYWAVRHSHILYLVGNLRAEIGNLKYDLKNREAAWMIENGGKYNIKWKAEHALSRSKEISRLRRLLVRAEGSLNRYEALAGSYEGLRNAASREIARRADERASKD